MALLQASQTDESNEKNDYNLEKKIYVITKSLSRAYYKNILLKLAEEILKMQILYVII